MHNDSSKNLSVSTSDLIEIWKHITGNDCTTNRHTQECIVFTMKPTLVNFNYQFFPSNHMQTLIGKIVLNICRWINKIHWITLMRCDFFLQITIAGDQTRHWNASMHERNFIANVHWQIADWKWYKRINNHRWWSSNYKWWCFTADYIHQAICCQRQSGQILWSWRISWWYFGKWIEQIC